MWEVCRIFLSRWFIIFKDRFGSYGYMDYIGVMEVDEVVKVESGE